MTTRLDKITTRVGFATSLALASFIAVGCVATASAPPPRGVVVSGPPPPPLVETRSAPPTAEATWVTGYWHWIGAQYAWIPGHWESAPPGASWYGPRYVTTEGHHYYEPGQWQGNRPQSPPATAKAIR